MENIDKLSKEIKVMLDNTGKIIDDQNSLFLSEIIYEFCDWYTGSEQKLEFKNKGELKKAIKDYLVV